MFTDLDSVESQGPGCIGHVVAIDFFVSHLQSQQHCENNNGASNSNKPLHSDPIKQGGRLAQDGREPRDIGGRKVTPVMGLELEHYIPDTPL